MVVLSAEPILLQASKMLTDNKILKVFAANNIYSVRQGDCNHAKVDILNFWLYLILEYIDYFLGSSCR